MKKYIYILFKFKRFRFAVFIVSNYRCNNRTCLRCKTNVGYGLPLKLWSMCLYKHLLGYFCYLCIGDWGKVRVEVYLRRRSWIKQRRLTIITAHVYLSIADFFFFFFLIPQSRYIHVLLKKHNQTNDLFQDALPLQYSICVCIFFSILLFTRFYHPCPLTERL